MLTHIDYSTQAHTHPLAPLISLVEMGKLKFVCVCVCAEIQKAALRNSDDEEPQIRTSLAPNSWKEDINEKGKTKKTLSSSFNLHSECHLERIIIFFA